IGKVGSEDILFNKELNPRLLKKGVESLYGVQLDLSGVKIAARSVEEYEQERSQLLNKISRLHNEFLEFREQQARDEQASLASISKKVAHLRNEITQIQYELDQDEQKSRQYDLDLHELKRKGEEHREKDLIAIYNAQEEAAKEIEAIDAKLNTLNSELQERLEDLRRQYTDRLNKITN